MDVFAVTVGTAEESPKGTVKVGYTTDRLGPGEQVSFLENFRSHSTWRQYYQRLSSGRAMERG